MSVAIRLRKVEGQGAAAFHMLGNSLLVLELGPQAPKCGNFLSLNLTQPRMCERYRDLV